MSSSPRLAPLIPRMRFLSGGRKDNNDLQESTFQAILSLSLRKQGDVEVRAIAARKVYMATRARGASDEQRGLRLPHHPR